MVSHLLISKLSAWKNTMGAMAKRREQCHESDGTKAPMAKRCLGKCHGTHGIFACTPPKGFPWRSPLEKCHGAHSIFACTPPKGFPRRSGPFLLNKKTCLLVKQEDMPSCSTRRHVFLFNKKTCLLVQQDNMSSCSTRGHVFLFNKKTCLLV